LIPTSGINGAEEQERRATSALLAVMTAVREFGRSILAVAGAPAGTIETYIEVPFELGEKRHYPDGLIRVRRGKRTWTALVEVKTSTNALNAAQLEAYLDIARHEGFDALLTISNEIAASSTEHPTAIDKRRLRKVALHHLSWTQVLTEAVLQKVHRGVADQDQAWILGELIRYLEHNRSGAMEFEDMGPSWVAVREEVHRGTLRPSSKGATEVASRWEQLLRYACLRLGRRLGVEVQPGFNRRETVEAESRMNQLVATMVASGVLEGGIRIPDAAAPVRVVADLRAGRVSCSVEVPAPAEGRSRARVSWLLRQLRDAPDDLRVDAFAARARGASTSELLKAVRAEPQVLIQDPARELRSFRVTLSAPLGALRYEVGTDRGVSSSGNA